MNPTGPFIRCAIAYPRAIIVGLINWTPNTDTVGAKYGPHTAITTSRRDSKGCLFIGNAKGKEVNSF